MRPHHSRKAVAAPFCTAVRGCSLMATRAERGSGCGCWLTRAAVRKHHERKETVSHASASEGIHRRLRRPQASDCYLRDQGAAGALLGNLVRTRVRISCQADPTSQVRGKAGKGIQARAYAGLTQEELAKRMKA